MHSVAPFLLAAMLTIGIAHAQTAAPTPPPRKPTPPPSEVAGIPVNYDETRTGAYTLPDPLVLANGRPVRNARTWIRQRRPEIVRLFEENQFGRTPARQTGSGRQRVT